jgi:GcrA cell cycle regulator
MTSWTEDRVERLKKYWAEGMSAGQIRDEIGGASRNAVIGKLWRLDLARCPNPVALQQPKPKQQDRRKPGAIASLVRPSRFGYAPDRPPEARVPLRYPAEPLPGSKPVSILDLTSTTCRWIIGDSRRPMEPIYCGAIGADNPIEPYCACHRGMAASPGRRAA